MAAKRFYKDVTVRPSGDGFGVWLDERQLKTPARAPVETCHQALAELIADEWNAQDETIKPDTMPVTRLVNVALDQSANREDELIAHVCTYAGSDLLCYRAAHPEALTQLQQSRWDPVLDWAAAELGLTLKATTGIQSIEQPPENNDRLKELLSGQSPLLLTVLAHLTAAYGSAVLALAVWKTHVDADTAFDLAHLDEGWQARQWGEDAETARNMGRLKAELNQLVDALHIEAG